MCDARVNALILLFHQAKINERYFSDLTYLLQAAQHAETCLANILYWYTWKYFSPWMFKILILGYRIISLLFAEVLPLTKALKQ